MVNYKTKYFNEVIVNYKNKNSYNNHSIKGYNYYYRIVKIQFIENVRSTINEKGLDNPYKKVSAYVMHIHSCCNLYMVWYYYDTSLCVYIIESYDKNCFK